MKTDEILSLTLSGGGASYRVMGERGAWHETPELVLLDEQGKELARDTAWDGIMWFLMNEDLPTRDA